jgi:hypothetical protein
MKFYNRYHNNQDWYFMGANWETSTILAFKMMAIVFEDREMYHRHDKVLDMLITSYIFLKKDIVPLHPIEYLGWERSLKEFMGWNVKGVNTYKLHHTELYWDENVKEGNISKQNCLFGDDVGRTAGWKIGDNPDTYKNLPDGVCMEVFRDMTHANMGTEGVVQIIKMMLIQGESVNRDWIDRALKSSITNAGITMGRYFTVRGNADDAKLFYRIKHYIDKKTGEEKNFDTYPYNANALDMVQELGGYDATMLQNKFDNYTLPYLSTDHSHMNHCGTASEFYMGLRDTDEDRSFFLYISPGVRPSGLPKTLPWLS